MTKKKLMTPNQVAEAFGVDVKTVTRWARAGKIPHTFTLGGHRRFDPDVVEALRAPIDPRRETPEDTDA